MCVVVVLQMVSIGSANVSLSVPLLILLILGMMIGTGSCAAVGDNGGKTTGLSTEIGIHGNEVYACTFTGN